MKAVVIGAYGGREQLKYQDVPEPQIDEHDLLLEARAASVNPVDWKIREGYLKSRIQYEFPLILGWDVAGVVRKIGSKVTRFKEGDEVFSRPDVRRNGTYAEFVAVDERLVAPMPKSLSFEEAASIPLVGLTSWQCLIDFAQMKERDKVLIHAGAGGVGTFAIQLAKAKGAYVATTVSTRNLDLARDLGADEVIDYNTQDFSQLLQGYDIVFDTLGKDIQLKSYRVLRQGGTLVSIASPPDMEAAQQAGVRAGYVFLEPDGEQLRLIGELIDDGKIRPVVGYEFPLHDLAKAHELSESGHARGKIVISIRPQGNGEEL